MSEPESPSRPTEASALAELALCENLAQTSGWAARWSSQLSGADATLLWAPDAVHPLFLCIGAHGDGTSGALRRSVSREAGIVRDMLRDRRARVLDRDEFVSRDDPWLKNLPASAQTSGWAARWSSQLSGADATLLWAPDAVHPLFLCIGAHGDGTSGALRRS
ncbi:MAG TPA: hypothetical protein VKJ00_02395, partial [Thermoanaerobaculia bacterium]|nr:hypothetical protein [Thermoanaerobaculia bacterium]